MHRFHAEAFRHEFGSKPIKQFGMRRSASQQTEIAGVLLQSFSEMPLPKAVHCYSRKKRILRGHQPLGEGLTAAIAELKIGRLQREARLDGLILLRLCGLAAC